MWRHKCRCNCRRDSAVSARAWAPCLAAPHPRDYDPQTIPVAASRTRRPAGGYPYEGLRRRQHPQRGRRRPRRMRQDPARLRHALRAPAPSTGWARSTTAPPSPTSTTKKSPASTRSPPASPTPSGRKPRSTSSTRPASPTSSPTPASALRVVEAAAGRRRRRAGVEVQTEKLWAEAAALNLPRIVARQPPRARARQPRAHARVAAPRLRPRDRADSAADRRGAGLHRRRRPGADEGADVRRRRQRQDDRGRDSRGAGRPGREGARTAHRDGGRSRRDADGGVLRGRHADAGAARGGAARRDRGRQALPAGLHVGAARHRHPAAARRDRRATCRRPPSATSRPSTTDGAETTVKASDTGAVHGVRVEDDCRSVRRAHHDAARRLRHAEVGHDRAQPDARRRGAARPPARAAGQDADARARAEGGRPRRGGQAEGHAHERPAGREDHAGQVRRDHVPRAGALLRHRAEEPRRRGQDQHARCSGCRKRIRPSATRAIRRRTNCCSPARASCTSRSPSRS